MILRRFALGGLMAALAVPALADEPVSEPLALSRLRACVTSGAAGAPRDSLAAAVVAVRSLCHPQLTAAYRAADRRVAAAHPRLGADELSALTRTARRAIDYDLALLVSTQTGLSQ